MITRTLLFTILCATATTALASRGPRPQPPVRMILEDQTLKPVEVQELNIRASISGGMAETTVRMVFFNPNPRQLEGNLQFPLMGNQQITAFALDINGEMRPAVPVAKEKGREVFEAIERRQVDPGLLEVTQGNNFKLRVYPIPARATRTVELTFAEPLQRRGANWAYTLPLRYGVVGNLDLQVDVNDATAMPTLTSLVPGVVFAPSNGGFTASLKRERTRPPEAIEVLTRAATEPRVYRQEIGNDTYFLAEIPAEQTRVRRKAPRVIGLLWDSSGSGSARDTQADIDELGLYLAALGNVEVRLTRLRDRPQATQVFPIEGGQWNTLRAALEKTVYDGASALNDWQPERSVDQYLLFSDGLSNYGGKRFPTLAAHQRLFALSSAQSADSNRLAALAKRAGGRLISIDRSTPGQASQALLTAETTIENINATGATDIEVESAMVSGGVLRVAGRLLAREARLALTLATASGPRSLNVMLSADAAPHPFAAAAWAAFRLRTLESDGDLHLAEIGRIGRRFGIPTRETSLIVLEQLDDYVRYDIEPPSQLVDQFRKRISARDARQAALRTKQFDTVLRRFEARKRWWATDYSRSTLSKSNMEPMKGMPAPAPAAVSSAAEMVGAQMNRDMSAREAVSVTGSRMKSADADKLSDRIGIALKKWEPNARYADRIKRASAGEAYQVYLDQKPDYANSSAFFLDAADILLDKGQRDLALRVLSNLSEMDLENRAVLRILGYRLLQAKAPELAVPVFEHVLRIAAEEPQSFRDLGLALAAAGRRQEAIDKLYEVIVRPWANRFPDIESTTLADINALIATSPTALDVSRIDPRLRMNMPLDIRVVLTWDADNTDMDLYVTDPRGEVASYSNHLTSTGGKMSTDFTGGYGPEEFALRRSEPGKYQIAVNYFGSRQQVIAGATTVQVKLFTHFGTPRQKEQLLTLRLEKARDNIFVGEFDVRP